MNRTSTAILVPYSGPSDSENNQETCPPEETKAALACCGNRSRSSAEAQESGRSQYMNDTSKHEDNMSAIPHIDRQWTACTYSRLRCAIRRGASFRVPWPTSAGRTPHCGTDAAVVFGRELGGGHEDDKPTNERTKVVNANTIIVTTFGRMQRIVIETRGKAQSCGGLVE